MPGEETRGNHTESQETEIDPCFKLLRERQMERVKKGIQEKESGITDEGGLEEGLGAAESLIADGDDLTVGQLIALLQRGGGGSGGHLILKVQGHVAQLLLDIADNFSLG
jgi:hypothetical protein